MNIIIITGASSGIGREFAYQIDQIFPHIDEVWLISRRQDRLQDTARIMQVPTRVIPMDITDSFEMELLDLLLKKEQPVIRMLVNCAGNGMVGDFSNLSVQEQSGMIRLNCEALTTLTHLCIPYMKKNSRMIQVASSAAFLPQKKFAVYAATKSYVVSFSRALREELKPKHIYVTTVCPGPVDTEFFELAEHYEEKYAFKNVYEAVENVVRNALISSYHKRSMSITGVPMKGFRVLSKVVPHEVLLQGVNVVTGILKRT